LTNLIKSSESTALQLYVICAIFHQSTVVASEVKIRVRNHNALKSLIWIAWWFRRNS